MIELHILSHNIVISPKDIRGSIEERYWIYKDLINFISRVHHSRIFWYSTKEKHLLQVVNGQWILLWYSSVRYLALLIKNSIRVKEPMLVIIAYPYASRGLNNLLFLLILITLKIISLFKENVTIIIDDIDPPAETAISDSPKPPSLLKYTLIRVYDFIVLKISTIIVVLTESYCTYFSRLYRMPIEKFVIIPPPALCKLISYSPPKTKGPLTVLYSGVVRKERNIEPVIRVIDELRNKGYEINLMITAPLILMHLPKHISCHNYPWPEYVREALTMADVAIIPYRYDKIHYSYTLVAKLFDYIAAGKPVITTPLYETLKIIRKCKCGFVFINEENLRNILKFIYTHREVLISMSKRGRQMAEKHFCSNILALKFLQEVIKRLSERYYH